MKPLLFFLLLLPACSAVPIKQVGEAVHKRIEARESPVQVCSCQTQCSIAEIPKN